jgi:hypothetical protein
VFRYAVVLFALVGLLAGCGATAEEEARAKVQDRLDGMHQSYLEARARDPYSRGPSALETLDPYGQALESSTDGDTITLVQAVGWVVERGGGLSYEQVSVGACIRVTIRAGAGGDDRGSVTTEPVSCRRHTEFETNKGDQDVAVETTDLDSHSDDVGEPEPDRPVCHSGEICTEGGG